MNIDEKELLKYFSENIDADKFLSALKVFEIKNSKSKTIKNLERKIEKMKCCGNCYFSNVVIWEDNRSPCYDCIKPKKDGVYFNNWKMI